MTKKGFVHLIPLIAVAFFIVGGSLLILSSNSENNMKKAVGNVLSSREGGEDDQSSNSGSGGDSKSSVDSSTNTTSGTSNTNNVEPNTNDSKAKIENKSGKTKIEIENKNGKFRTEIKDNKNETKIRKGNLRIEIKQEGDKLVTKIKNEDDDEVEVEATEEAELLDRAENELEDDDIKIATGSAQTGFIQKGRRVRTNFPLSINPSTGELFVTTPSGVKVVTILPQEAIENMIKAGVLTRVEEPPTPVPPESTSSSNILSVEGAPIEITEVNNTPTYIISGVKAQKMLGFIPVDIKIKTYVSAADGSLINIQESLLSRILDLISF